MDIKNLLIFCSLMAAIEAQSHSTKFLKNVLYYNNSVLRTDNYIDLNRRQYADNILECDRQLVTSTKNFKELLNIIDIQLEMLVDGIIKSHERLNPLEVLSDVSKDCVAKYRPKIPTVAVTKSAIQGCIAAATGQLNNMISAADTTKKSLQTYYNNYFENELKNCQKRFPTLDVNYSQCTTRVVATTNTYTMSMEKTFDVQMDAAECSYKANIKKALDCSYIVQNRTIALTAEADTMIDRCLHGQDDCDRCSEGHFCESIYYIPKHQVSYHNSTMINPFIGRNASSVCVMLEIY